MKQANEHNSALQVELAKIRLEKRKGASTQEEIDGKPLELDHHYDTDISNVDPIDLNINAYSTHLQLAQKNDDLHQQLKDIEKELLKEISLHQEFQKKFETVSLELEEEKTKSLNLEKLHQDAAMRAEMLAEKLEIEKRINEENVKISFRNQQIDALAQKLSDIQEENVNYHKENQELLQKLENLQIQLDDSNMKVSKLHGDIEDQKNKNQISLDLQSDKFKRQIELLEEEQETLKNTINEKQTEIDRLKLTNKELNDQLQHNHKNQVTDRQQSGKADKQVKKLEDKVNEQNEQILQLNLENNKIKQRWQEEKEKSAKALREKSDVEYQLKLLERDLKKQINELSEKYNKALQAPSTPLINENEKPEESDKE
uniref:Uncharacterized protein n=1 Tax=Arcella intermedia TaxID=1963864 RepID=A0A6B2L766_9EUKA